jgi:hypothetical protein
MSEKANASRPQQAKLSRRLCFPIQFVAILTEAFELWVLTDRCVATLQADKPTLRARQHRRKILTQGAIRAANDLLSHFNLSIPVKAKRLALFS